MEKRIIDLSYKHKLSHLGSCLTTAPILKEIFESRRFSDKVVLSSGHAGLALYTANEQYYGIDAEETLLKYGIHPVRDPERMIDVSTGSLGQGISVALGLALSDQSRDVHCIVSDGELAEGVCWESLRLKTDMNIDNLKIHVNMNGFSAYDMLNVKTLESRINAFADVKIHRTQLPDVDFLKGLKAHYHVMSDEDYKQLCTLY